MKKISSISGWIGIVLLQIATIPTTIKLLLGTAENIPPIDMVILLWLGLGMLLFRSICHREIMYIVSNTIGFVFQSILLILLIKKYLIL